MTDKNDDSKKKRPVTEIGSQVPSNFKFAVIVAIAIFWADFIRSIFDSIFSSLHIPVLSDLLIAIIVTALGYSILISYRRVKSRLEKIKV